MLFALHHHILLLAAWLEDRGNCCRGMGGKYLLWGLCAVIIFYLVVPILYLASIPIPVTMLSTTPLQLEANTEGVRKQSENAFDHVSSPR